MRNNSQQHLLNWEAEMTVNIDWHDESQQILRYDFIDKWTWEEYFAALSVGRSLMTTVPHFVCILNNMTSTTHLPDDFLTKARNVTGSRPLNTGRAVFASSDTFFVKVHATLGQLSPDWAQNYRREDTLEAALHHLQQWLLDHPQLPGELK
jgi:hypothetical protein